MVTGYLDLDSCKPVTSSYRNDDGNCGSDVTPLELAPVSSPSRYVLSLVTLSHLTKLYTYRGSIFDDNLPPWTSLHTPVALDKYFDFTTTICLPLTNTFS